MNNSFQLVRVFDKANVARGNLAAIFFNNNQSELSEFIEASLDIEKKHNIATTCFIEPLINEHYVVRCFNAENEIQCCGHGLIAAAKTLFLKRDISAIVINGNLNVLCDNEDKENTQITLALPRLSSVAQIVPTWAKDCMTFEDENLIPSHSAISDKNDGYLLFEFEQALKLDEFSTLQVNLKRVCESTKRAVVLIQFEQEKKHLYIRYFAPQYGVLEDSATGSVMRFVGDYVEQKYQCAHFEVSQCSSQGGFMKIECTTEQIIITANATIET